MKKLYGINVNENIWNVEKREGQYDFVEYTLTDLNTKDKYIFNNAIGITEIADHEVLVDERMGKSEWRLSRIKLSDSKMEKLFSIKFQSHVSLNEDRILFSHYGRSADNIGDGIYSISDNKLVEDFDWLKGKKIAVYRDDNDKTIIYVEDLPAPGNSEYFLSFAVDSETLKPMSKCYSSLRDKYIEINSVDDYEQLKDEDRKYIYIIDSIKMHDRIESKNKAREKILELRKKQD